jgi:hypothetical protein
MAGLVPAIHVFGLLGIQDVDARDKRGHDNTIRYRHSLGNAASVAALAGPNKVTLDTPAPGT